MNRRFASVIALAMTGCQIMPKGITDLARTQSRVTPTASVTSMSDEKLIRSEPTSKQAAAACVETARTLQSQGHGREAIVLYERARVLNPKEPNVSRFLALLYDQAGNDSRAEAEYRNALEAAPRDADLLNDWGYYHFRRKNWLEAEKHFREAIAVSPNHERASVNLGLALGEQSRYEEAFDAFARNLGPAAAHSNVGVILAGRGHIEQARKEFQKALAIQPDLKQSHSFLAYLDSADGSKAEVLAETKRETRL